MSVKLYLDVEASCCVIIIMCHITIFFFCSLLILILENFLRLSSCIFTNCIYECISLKSEHQKRQSCSEKKDHHHHHHHSTFTFYSFEVLWMKLDLLGFGRSYSRYVRTTPRLASLLDDDDAPIIHQLSSSYASIFFSHFLCNLYTHTQQGPTEYIVMINITNQTRGRLAVLGGGR